ncbi:MAG: hypothetical protein R3268_15545, partial [Acidiferrobacterales bacterium]|nr:hypothetical protein [Acidiferrobacterales bacterium]
PYGHGDFVPGFRYRTDNRVVGCLELLQRVREVKPKVHFFGHIHEGYGVSRSDGAGLGETLFVNASICDGDYKPINKPQVVRI